MSAPRKIWVDYERDMFSFTEAAPTSSCPESVTAYHHDDVVRELVEALEEIKSLPRGEAGFCRPIAEAALAKIAQEG